MFIPTFGDTPSLSGVEKPGESLGVVNDYRSNSGRAHRRLKLTSTHKHQPYPSDEFSELKSTQRALLIMIIDFQPIELFCKLKLEGQ